MPKITMPLTPKSCDALKPAAGKKIARKSDGASPGLLLEARMVNQNKADGGTREVLCKWWRWRYRHNGKDSTLTIGSYPATTLAAARDKAHEMSESFRKDPTMSAYRQNGGSATESVTFGEWFYRWLDDPKSGVSRSDGGRQPLHPAAVRQVRSAFSRILGSVADVRLADLTIGHIKPHIEGYSDTAPVLARRLKQYVSRCLLEAVPEHLSDTPLRGAEFKMGAKRPHPHPELIENEIGEIISAVLGGPAGAEVKGAYILQWWTLCRPGEAAGARWDEFDLDAGTWTIPGERMKMGLATTRPLPRQALAFLKALPRRGPWLFPSQRREGPISSNSISVAVCGAGLQGRHTPHSIRHFSSSWLNGHYEVLERDEYGDITKINRPFHPDWIERQLAHVPGTIRGVYNRAEYLPERRFMMQTWANHLDTLAPELRRFAQLFYINQ
ncbi:tyrosine-type recombinase/integrase [Aeromonas sp. 604534]|uniref:tyrosine-type recombinase/integrase n=1 Tax=Aeromonas sp. 604534 TaxID=2712055 RepID=UPI003B9EB256